MKRVRDPEKVNVLWTRYQMDHIERRHGVTRIDFESAWRDRDDLCTFNHTNGAYTKSLGFTDHDRLLEMIWRRQGRDVWAITAYFVEEE